MKRLVVGSAVALFATSVMATFMETEKTPVPCQWVVDIHTTSFHGALQYGHTPSEPRCVPIIETRDVGLHESNTGLPSTITLPCHWIADVYRSSVHGIPQDGHTTGEPRCVPTGTAIPIGWTDAVKVPELETLVQYYTVGRLKRGWGSGIHNCQ